MADYLKHKEKNIRVIYDAIIHELGIDYFEKIDFWDSDNYAIGLKKEEKIIYISTWNFRNLDAASIKYYAEFEIIDLTSLETLETKKILDAATKEELVVEVVLFYRNK
jgi:hypothetical protein